MPLVFAAAANHAPGITARRDAAAPRQREVFFAAWDALRHRLEAARLDALIVVSSEHYTNFFVQLNVEFDRAFVDDFLANDAARMTRHSDEEIVRAAGPGGHEIRSWIVAAAAAGGNSGEVLCFEPIPAYAVTGCIATLAVQ